MIQCDHNALDQVAHVDEVAFHWLPIRVEHKRHCAALHIFFSSFRPHKVSPAWTAEHIVTERERILEIVLLHNPRRPQTAPREIVLDKILFQHHLFENFGERVATRISAVSLLSVPEAGVDKQNVLRRHLPQSE